MKSLRFYFSKDKLFVLLLIVSASVLSFGLVAFIFSDVFIKQRYSFIRFSDIECGYMGVFTLLNQFYNGGLQLWNKFDQMPIGYFHLTAGLYTYSNLLTAGLYILVERFFESQAQAFQVVFTYGFFGTTFFVRCVGGYLLARHFTQSRKVILGALVIFNVLMIPHFHMGYSPNAIYSLFFLLAHFLLSFFERPQWKYLIAAGFSYSLVVATGPMFAVGYFYQGVHFLLLSCLAWKAWMWLRKVRDNKSSSSKRGAIYRIPVWLISTWHQMKRCTQLTSHQRKIILGLGCVSFFIIAPSLLLMIFNYPDYEMDHNNSRLHNAMSVKAYFQRGFGIAPKEEILWRWVDFTQSDWAFSWLFMGYLTIFLIMCALFLNQDHRKYIFLITAFLFWVINSPRVTHTVTDLAHWLNALTNPFKFMPNSFHMVGALLLPFVLFALIVMGLEVLRQWLYEEIPSDGQRRLLWGALCLCVVVLCVFLKVTMPVKVYIFRGLVCSILLGGSLFWFRFNRRIKRVVVLLLLLGLFIVDCQKMSAYAQLTLKQIQPIPHEIKGLEPVRFVDLDFRNPRLLPVREFFLNHPIGSVKPFLMTDAINMTGLMYQYTNLFKFFHPINSYKPRHRSYKDWPGASLLNVYYPMSQWPGDREMFNYIAKDARFIIFAPWAVPYKEGLMRELLDENLDRAVVMLHELPVDSKRFASRWPPELSAPTEPNPRFSQTELFLTKAQKIKEHYDLKEYLFDLPKDFSADLSTSIFTQDRDKITLQLLKKEISLNLTPAQGRLVAPYSFDVGNMYDRKLSVLIPAQDQNQRLILRYEVKNLSSVTSVWRNEYDRFGFNFEASDDGWLLFHMPYDLKWRLSINGRLKNFYRANKSFMAFPVSVGHNQIFLSYWPESPIRPMLYVSLILYSSSLVGLLVWSVYEE